MLPALASEIPGGVYRPDILRPIALNVALWHLRDSFRAKRSAVGRYRDIGAGSHWRRNLVCFCPGWGRLTPSLYVPTQVPYIPGNIYRLDPWP